MRRDRHVLECVETLNQTSVAAYRWKADQSIWTCVPLKACLVIVVVSSSPACPDIETIESVELFYQVLRDHVFNHQSVLGGQIPTESEDGPCA